MPAKVDSFAIICLQDKRTPIHEMMHSLGIYHEHTRPDQTDYVTVNYANINSGSQSNFQPKDPSEVELYGTEYSYASVMHYGRRVRCLSLYKRGQIIIENGYHLKKYCKII